MALCYRFCRGFSAAFSALPRSCCVPLLPSMGCFWCCFLCGDASCWDPSPTGEDLWLDLIPNQVVYKNKKIMSLPPSARRLCGPSVAGLPVGPVVSRALLFCAFVLWASLRGRLSLLNLLFVALSLASSSLPLCLLAAGFVPRGCALVSGRFRRCRTGPSLGLPFLGLFSWAASLRLHWPAPSLPFAGLPLRCLCCCGSLSDRQYFCLVLQFPPVLVSTLAPNHNHLLRKFTFG